MKRIQLKCFNRFYDENHMNAARPSVSCVRPPISRRAWSDKTIELKCFFWNMLIYVNHDSKMTLIKNAICCCLSNWNRSILRHQLNRMVNKKIQSPLPFKIFPILELVRRTQIYSFKMRLISSCDLSIRQYTYIIDTASFCMAITWAVLFNSDFLCQVSFGWMLCV